MKSIKNATSKNHLLGRPAIAMVLRHPMTGRNPARWLVQPLSLALESPLEGKVAGLSLLNLSIDMTLLSRNSKSYRNGPRDEWISGSTASPAPRCGRRRAESLSADSMGAYVDNFHLHSTRRGPCAARIRHTGSRWHSAISKCSTDSERHRDDGEYHRESGQLASSPGRRR